MRVFQYRVAVMSACLPIAVAISGCNQPPAAQPATPATPAAAAAPAQTPAERGKVLVTVGGCHDCHSPKKIGPGGPEPDMSRALSGHPQDVKVTAGFKAPKGSPYTIHTIDHLTAWSGAWGVSFAANLTPDPDTGMSMPERSFLAAMKSGAHLGSSRPILPPMPWQMYAQLSDDDLKAIYAYLKTLAPVKNKVPDPIPPAK
jgi:mono/diheme cytochrome c family protein